MGVRSKCVAITAALLLVVLAVPAAQGDDIDPNQPPEARIKPPIGVQTTPPSGAPTDPPEARIKPPGDLTAQADLNPANPPEARINPPIGSQSAGFLDFLSRPGFYARLMTFVW